VAAVVEEAVKALAVAQAAMELFTSITKEKFYEKICSY
jgi:hypothetical protein